MKRRLKIDYDGEYYRLYVWEHAGFSFSGKEKGDWKYINLFYRYEDAQKSANEVLKFPKYFESKE